MPDYDFDIGILGGGAAGLTVASGAAQLGAKTLLVEKEKELGEINKRVAGTYFSPKIFSNKVKKGLKFFFNLKGRACSLGIGYWVLGIRYWVLGWVDDWMNDAGCTMEGLLKK